jgi:1-acyl-sn-glycerol-3-phosphate acyltransferase
VLDVTIAVALADRPVYFMAKVDLWKKPLGCWFATKSECIPVQRDGNDVKAVMSAMRKLKNEEIVFIFPEGTRNKTKEPFLPFKGGAAVLSLKTHTPIVPIVFLNKFKLFRKTYVIVGEPFEFTDYYNKKLTEEDFAKCEEELRNRLLKLREDFLNSLPEKKRKKLSKK